MSEILLHGTRGNLIENIHRGDIAVVQWDNTLLGYAGDPYKRSFMRSCTKPIQALPVIESGAAQEYGISGKELAVICASHYAESHHIESVESILSKLGSSEEDLRCGPTYSLKEAVTHEMLRAGAERKAIFNNCSGKHAGMLAIAKRIGFTLTDYDNVNHPLQQHLLNTIADVCEVEVGSMGIGIDGCGVPVVEMPLYNMALSFAKLTHSDIFESPRKAAADAIVSAMTAHPEMVAGTGGFCTELMKNTSGKLVGKLGADAVYCIGILGKGIGIAVKIEDGNMNVLSCAVMETLKQCNFLDSKELMALESFHIKENVNSLRQKVGEVRPVFTLKDGKPQ